jgi:transcription elongation factor GreA
MSEIILEKLENLLNEEKWTRATINNYTIKNFEDLNKLIVDFKSIDVLSKTKEMTLEYLRHNKNSIVALYIASMLQIEEGNIDDNSIYNLLKIFSDNLKWNIVEYLCKKVLVYVEDKIVLRTLIDSYKNLNKKDELPELWERLIKVDYEEAELVVKLANIREQKNEIDEAINYYKKALNRFIITKNFIQVEELWKKLLTFDDIGREYFFNLDKKISKNFSHERAIELLKYLYEVYKSKEDYDVCIKILKLILEKNPLDEFSRKEIVDSYKKKYSEHSYLDEYIKISNLDGQWRNIFDAISSFERHIAFDKGNFVYHRSWGIGRIKEVSKDIFTIDFQSKKDHKMKLEMALNSLKTLPKNHIWVLKLKNPEKLKKMIKEDVPWALKVLIASYDNKATMKNMKDELVPEFLTTSGWNTWWNEARKILKTDPKFGTLDNENDVYEVREKPLSFEEKTYNSFKAAKDFNQRFNFILDYIENADNDSEYLEDMIAYFMTFLNSLNNVDEQTICSYLLIMNIQKKFAFLKLNPAYSFKDFLDQIEDPILIYENINFSDYKKDFLLFLKRYHKKWDEIYIRIFYLYPNRFIFDELQNKDPNLIEKVVRELISGYKEYKEAFFWITTNILNEEKIKEMNIDYDNIILSLIHLVEITGKEVSLKKDVTKNKKISNQTKDFLFKNNFLPEYIKKADIDFCKRLYTISNELLSLDGESVVIIKDTIVDKFPDIDTEDNVLKFDAGMGKSSIIDRLLTTEESFSRMQKELLNIKDVEIPENSKEIGWAMEKGDLKENAEFKAAKERQTFLQNKLNKLMNDLGRAIIVKKDEISGKFITFGTKVTLKDKMNNSTVTYTILGPWESDTEKNIISYQSPLGANLLDKKINDEIKFVLNDKTYDYTVENIEVYNF